MAQDELPIKIVVHPPDASQVSQVMADIEARVSASGRKIGKALNVNPKLSDSHAKEFRASVDKLFKHSLSVQSQMTSAYAGELKRRKTLEKTAFSTSMSIQSQMTKAFVGELKRRESVKKASVANSLAIEKQMTKAFVGELKRRELEVRKVEAERKRARLAAIAHNKAIEKQMTSAFIGELKRRERLTKASAAKSKAQAFQRSPEGIFKAAGIKGSGQRLTEIKALKTAQEQLRRELARGTITRLQYNTMLKDTHKRMNLLERGDVRARGALHRFTAQLASTTFEITGAIFGLTALGAALASPAILGTRYLMQLEDVKLGISGILLAMGSINHEMISFAQASAAADEQINKLSDDAVSLAGTLEDFTRSFQAILAPGLAAGMTLDEIRKISVAGTVAVKTIGLDSRQIVQEIRDLVAGGIQAASSTLATSLGLRDSDIKKARLSSEGLFNFLTRKLDGFRVAGLQRSETLSGKIEQTYEIFIRGLAKASEPVFETLKELFDDVSKRIATIDKATGKLTFNPGFIDGITAFVKGINLVFKALIAVVKVMFDFKEVLIGLIALKAGKVLWNVLNTAAKAYHATIKGLIVSETILATVQAGSGKFTAAPKAKDAAIKGLGASGGSLASASVASSLFSKEGIRKAMKEAGSTIIDSLKFLKKNIVGFLGKFGLLGIVITGVAGTIGLAASAIPKIANIISPDIEKAKAFIKKFEADAKQTSEQILSDQIKVADSRVLSLTKSVEGIRNVIRKVEKTGDTKALNKLVPILRDLEGKLASATDKSDAFGDAALSISDRIKRMSTLISEAEKAVNKLGGEYVKGAKNAEAQINAVNKLNKLVTEQARLEKQISEAGVLGASPETLKSKKDVDSRLVALRESAKFSREILNLEIEVKLARKGSKLSEQLKDELIQKKALSRLTGEQRELEKALEHLRISKDQDAENAASKKAIQLLLTQNRALQDSANAILPGAQAQERFNDQIKEVTRSVPEYIKSLADKRAAEKVELSEGRKSGFELSKEKTDAEFINRVIAIQQAFDKLRSSKFAKGDADQIAILNQQEENSIRALGKAYMNTLPEMRSFYEAKDAKKWAAEITEVNSITREYIKTIEDMLEVNRVEQQFAGRSELEISILKIYQAEQDELNKLTEKYNKLQKDANPLANARSMAEETGKINDVTNELVETLKRRNAEERKWTTGAITFFTEYISQSLNAAELTATYFGNVMSSLNSDLATYFQTGKDNFEDFRKVVSRGLAEIAAQMVSASLVQGIMGVVGAVRGPGTPSIQPVPIPPNPTTFAIAKGAAFDNSGLMAFAKGGIVSTPTTFPFAKGTGLMGEAGPEAIMPLSRTTSGDLGVKVSGSQGGVVNEINVTVNIDSSGNTEVSSSGLGEGIDGKGVGDALGQVVQAEILKQMRPGGLLMGR